MVDSAGHKLIYVTCPNCGANISMDSEKGFGVCEYCDSKIMYKNPTNKTYINNKTTVINQKESAKGFIPKIIETVGENKRRNKEIQMQSFNQYMSMTKEQKIEHAKMENKKNIQITLVLTLFLVMFFAFFAIIALIAVKMYG